MSQAVATATRAHAYLRHTDQDRTLQAELIARDTQATIGCIEALMHEGEKLTQVELLDRLEQLLADPWQVIAGSYLSYTAIPSAPNNQLRLKLAQLLHQYRPEKSPYQYLMPTLSATIDVLELNGAPLKIDDIALERAILSSDGSALIPTDLIANFHPDNCPFSAIKKPFVSELGQAPVGLTEDEQERLIVHSQQSQNFYQSSCYLHDFDGSAVGLSAELARLIASLKRGGANGGNDGKEREFGIDAKLGLIHFMTYWEQLAATDRDKFSALTDPADNYQRSLGDVLAILTRKKKGFTCVEVNASILEKILLAHPELHDDPGIRASHERRLQECRSDIDSGVDGRDNVGLNESLIDAFNLIDVATSEKDISAAITSIESEDNVTDQEQNALICFLLKHASCQSLMKTQKSVQGCLTIYEEDGSLDHMDNSLIFAIKRDPSWVLAILSNPQLSPELFTQKNRHGEQALHVAARHGNMAVFEHCIKVPEFSLLLQRSAVDGLHPLQIAVFHHQYEIVHHLIDSGSVEPVLFTAENDDSIVEYAADDPQMLYILLDSPEIPSAVFEENAISLFEDLNLGSYILQKMIQANQPAVVNALIHHPGFPQSSFDCLALHHAIHQDVQTIFDVMLNSSHMNSDILAIDNIDGLTPLLYAIDLGRVDMAIQLVSHPNMTLSILCKKDRVTNRTALDHATANGQVELVQAIQEAQRRLFVGGGQRYCRFFDGTPASSGINIDRRNEYVDYTSDEYADYTSDEDRNSGALDEDDDDHAFNFGM